MGQWLWQGTGGAVWAQVRETFSEITSQEKQMYNFPDTAQLNTGAQGKNKTGHASYERPD